MCRLGANSDDLKKHLAAASAASFSDHLEVTAFGCRKELLEITDALPQHVYPATFQPKPKCRGAT